MLKKYFKKKLGTVKTEECITFHDEDRDDQLKEVADLILKRK